MSLDEHELQADELLEARTGTRVPFTMVGDWVLMSTMSVQAKLLYALLQAHVNIQSGERKVWPARETLAGWMGFNRPQSVDRYIDELVKFGAITVEKTQRGMKTRHVYYVNGEAPDGLSTPTRFADFYRARNDERGRQAPASGRTVSPGRADMRPSAQRASAEAVSAGEEDVRPSAQRYAPQRSAVVRPSAPEQDEVLQQDQEGGYARAHEQPPTRTPARDAPPPPKADWRNPNTCLCAEHLPVRLADPGADLPPCGRCASVKEWGKRKRAETSRSEAEVRRDCLMCNADGVRWDERHVPLSPMTTCDHVTPTGEVVRGLREAEAARQAAAEAKAKAAELEVREFSSAEVRRRALAAARLPSRPKTADGGKRARRAASLPAVDAPSPASAPDDVFQTKIPVSLETKAG